MKKLRTLIMLTLLTMLLMTGFASINGATIITDVYNNEDTTAKEDVNVTTPTENTDTNTQLKELVETGDPNFKADLSVDNSKLEGLDSIGLAIRTIGAGLLTIGINLLIALLPALALTDIIGILVPFSRNFLNSVGFLSDDANQYIASKSASQQGQQPGMMGGGGMGMGGLGGGMGGLGGGMGMGGLGGGMMGNRGLMGGLNNAMSMGGGMGMMNRGMQPNTQGQGQDGSSANGFLSFLKARTIVLSIAVVYGLFVGSGLLMKLSVFLFNVLSNALKFLG